MRTHPLLSICIPTYNRADILYECISAIVTDNYFSDEVEIVVSDNCSTDNTKEVVDSFSRVYSNVKYYINDYNIGGDRNILKSLCLGNGEYLKLLNDYSVFIPGGLQFLLNAVKLNLAEKPIIYISRKSNNSCKCRTIDSLEEIILLEKWGLSWIGNYGFWNDDFKSLENKDSRIDINFQQVDWLIRSFNKKKKIVYYSRALTIRKSFKSKQGDYNFFLVHSKNYFIQFDELYSKGVISKIALESLKKDVLHGLVKWIIVLKLFNNKYSYSHDGLLKILNDQFGSYPWYYKDLVIGVLKVLYEFVFYDIAYSIYRKHIKPLFKKCSILCMIF